MRITVRPFLVAAAVGLVLGATSEGRASMETCRPVIDGISPPAIFVGETIVIRGACLTGGTPEEMRLSMGDASVVVTAVSDTEVVAQVNSPSTLGSLKIDTPAGASEGTIRVKNWVEPPPDSYLPGFLEFKLAPGENLQEVVAQLEGSDPRPIFEGWDLPGLGDWWRVQVTGDTIVRVREWAAHGAIEWVQPNVVRAGDFAAPPNDPCYPDPTPPSCNAIQDPQTGHGDDGQWGMQRVSAEVPGPWRTATHPCAWR